MSGYVIGILNFVLRMASLAEALRRFARQVFPWAWRLTILLLPWQTRWFAEGSKIAGFPWEEGRLSVYISQLAMLLVAFLALLASTKSWREQFIGFTDQLRKTWKIWCVLLAFGVSTFVTTISFRATIEWWWEVLVLGLFFCVIRSRVPLRDWLFWFVGSLIPEALLAIWQAYSQEVQGFLGLGIASQHPTDLGVAVIEHLNHRWLRAYAGFPHPNIFAGWIALAIFLVVQYLQMAFVERSRRIFYYVCLGLFSSALIFSYSRSAWLALVLALSVQLIHWLRSNDTLQRKILRFAFVVIFCAGLGSIALRPGLVVSRGQAQTRLEQKSVSERAQGLENGWRVWQSWPLTGSGPGTVALAIAQTDQYENRVAKIPVVPHVVPLLALAEVGILGVLVAIYLIWIVACKQFGFLRQKYLNRGYVLMSFILFLLPLFFLDHYLWSYWSGKGLFGWIILFGSFFLLDSKEEQGK